MTLSTQLIDPEHNTIVIEQYRTLRTNLEFLRKTRHLQSIAIASGTAEAGKTLTVANLAMAFAMADVKTLVLDADLRRPSQHQLFDLDNRQGLTTALMQGADMATFAQPGPLPSLFVMTSGPLPPTPAELFASGRAETLLAQLERSFDMVLIDTPPLLLCAESLSLCHAADGVVYVVRSGRNSVRLDRRAFAHLEQSQTKILGAVLNDAQFPQTSTYYYG